MPRCWKHSLPPVPRKTPSALRHTELRYEPFHAMLCPMSKRIDIWGTIRNVISILAGGLGYSLAFLRLMLKPVTALDALLSLRVSA